MAACILCGKNTEATIYEPNVCKDFPLCDECRRQFEQCTGCGGYCYPEELDGGKCENCQN